MKIADYEVHPAALLFPMLPQDELKELSDDIKAHGLIHPIILFDKMILDGRNRLVACGMAGVGPYFRNLQGEHSPTEYVMAVNLKRRQLTPSQRATVAAAALPMLEAEAKERQSRKSVPEKIPEQSKGDARDKAAKLANVNGRYVSDAKKIKAESPKLFMEVAEGEKTLSEAKKELRIGQPAKTPEHDNLLLLKRLWSKCTSKEKTAFLKWIGK